ncbi:N-methylhydantoinase B [Stella humosa]|uniref:N-methylhydantoinase B n=1 Tax=Stella humosa TaxID=94 RepID=A0A3N1M963_9PROT|nr:hydantoinase B/oxoprolinase family protein [Stella humosa]ROQ00223.1 N-methylhydantoinase B [Stella humosa]BBK30542.1 5-oxoprolinase [Stella humosa]
MTAPDPIRPDPIRPDPIRLEIIRHALVAAAEEMSITVWRTSRSSVVREILDYSTCVFDANGRSIAQAARMPVHLNSMPSCLADILAGPFPIEGWDEGDVIVTNDPYAGGQHLPDIQTFKPVFVDGRLVAIAGILVHHLDVGGGAPGSYYAQATEIFHEGFRIPPLKLVERGRRNEQVIQLLLRNSREPENVGGDFASQLAALDVGVANLQRLARRYGPDTLQAAADAIQDQSEAAMRRAIAAIPDGTWKFTDHVDDDGIEDRPLAVAVTLTVAGDTIAVDLAGSSPQAAGPVNCTLNMTSSAVICGVMMAIGADIPANAGCYRPITIAAPPGSVVNALSPAPVANRMAIGHRVVNAVLGAFAGALPGQIPAAYYGVSYAYALGSRRTDGQRQVYFDLECGGWGGHPDADGAAAFSCGFHNISSSPVEMIEATYPVRFLRYGLAPDTGGAGFRRGGTGLERSFLLTAPEGRFAANLDRFKFAPYGLEGGEPGSTGRLEVRRSGSDDWQSLPSKVAGLPLAVGDAIRLVTSGGGGWGDPAGREAARVADDVADGYVSAGAAGRQYGPRAAAAD